MKDFKLEITIPDGFNQEDDLDAIISSSIIESNIPAGSGLGSSAALSVALARCLTDEAEVFHLAKNFEDRFHAGSSGIDVFTSASGGLCRLHSKIIFEKLPAEKLIKLRKFKFSVVDTNERRKVSEVKSKISPQDMNQYLPEAANISKEFEAFFDFSDAESTIDKLIHLFKRSHSALVKLKVSTPLIDAIASSLQQAFQEDLGVKITGAGGGGCLLLVHDENVMESHISAVLNSIDFNLKLYYNIEFLE